MRENEYLRILGLEGKFSYENKDLIERKIINAVPKENSFISTRRFRKDLGDYHTVYIKKGKTKHSLILSNDQYADSVCHELQIETIDVAKDKVFTTKPHPKVEEDWDKRTASFLKHTGEMKEQIEQYRNKDLEYLRVNLFIKPELANIVETHITETQKVIEKIELDIREIQNSYKKLKDEEIILDD